MEMSKTSLTRIAIGLAAGLTAELVLVLGGCASVPAFKPSKPIEEAKSLQEGLLLCNEYRLPTEAKRPVTLRPFLNCVDDVQDRFRSEAAGSPQFETFRDEFHTLYGTLSDQTWSERLGTELEISLHTMLRALWRTEKPTVTPLERELVLRNFPITAERLNAASWTVSSSLALDPKLETLRAGVGALGGGDQRQEAVASQRSVGASNEVIDLCRRYFRIRDEVHYLDGLWRDQYDLTLLAPHTSISSAVRDKYTRHLDAASHELEDLRPKIAQARANGSFRVLACRP
jgi:hypothetical protein